MPEAHHVPAADNVPDPSRVVVTGSRELRALGVEGDIGHLATMAEGVQLFAARDAP